MSEDKGVVGGLNAKLPGIKGEGFLRKDIAPILGVSGRTIQVYTDREIVVPQGPISGKGTKRRYSKQDVFELLLIQKLLRHGINLSEVKPIIQLSSEAFKNLPESQKRKKLVLILGTNKHKSEQDKASYKVNLTTDLQFDFVANLTKFESILILDVSEIVNKLNLL
jgi:DNA-binding transcriptional MerR regulator